MLSYSFLCNSNEVVVMIKLYKSIFTKYAAFRGYSNNKLGFNRLK